MKWFLVIWVSTGTSFGGILNSYPSGSVSTQLEMPSQEICEIVRDLNKFNAECWSKPNKKEGN